jgi:hypothetical protein
MKSLARALLVAVVTVPTIASAGTSVSIAIGRAGQQDSTTETDSKTLSIGYSFSNSLAAELSLESLAATAPGYPCSSCTVAGNADIAGRAFGASVRYTVVNRGILRPYILAGVAMEDFSQTYSSVSFLRKEIGVGISVALSSQLRLFGDLRTGSRDLQQSEQPVLQTGVLKDGATPLLPYYGAGPYNDGASFRSAQVGVAVSF